MKINQLTLKNGFLFIFHPYNPVLGLIAKMITWIARKRCELGG